MNYIKITNDILLEMDIVKVTPGSLFKSTKIVGRLINLFTSIDTSDENINKIVFYRNQDAVNKVETILRYISQNFGVLKRTEMGTHIQVSIPNRVEILTTMPEGKWFVYNHY